MDTTVYIHPMSAVVLGAEGNSFSGMSLDSIPSGDASTCRLFDVPSPHLLMLANLAVGNPIDLQVLILQIAYMRMPEIILSSGPQSWTKPRQWHHHWRQYKF